MTTYYAYLFPAPPVVSNYPPFAIKGYDLGTFNLTTGQLRQLTCFEWTRTVKSKNIAGRTWMQTLCFADYSQQPHGATITFDNDEKDARYTRVYRLDDTGSIVATRRTVVPHDVREGYYDGPWMRYDSGIWRLAMGQNLRPTLVPAHKLITGPGNRR